MRTFFRPASLRSAIVLAVVATVVPVLALSFYHAVKTAQQQQDELDADADRLAAQIAAGMSRYLEGTRQFLVALAHNAPIRRLQPDAATPVLEEMRGTVPIFGNLILVDSSGNLVASALPAPPGTNVADRAYFRRLQTNRRIGLGDYLVGRVTKRPMINVACPLPDQPADGPLACVAASLTLALLEPLLDDFPRSPDTGLYLLDRNGTVLAQRGVPFAANGTPFPGWPRLLAQRSSFELSDATGRAHTARFAPVPSADNGLWVVVSQLRSIVTRDARTAFARSLALTSLSVFAALVLAWWIAERLVIDPTRQIARTASALASGTWTARARITHGAAELRALGQTFDDMAEHLHSQLRQLPAGRAELVATRERLQQAIAAQHAADLALRRSQATARAFIDSLTEKALLLAPDGTVLLANQTAAERLRHPLPELLGVNIATVMAPKRLARQQEQLRIVLETRHPVAFDDELPDRMLHTELTPVLDPAGNVAAIALISFDITERHQMEERLRRTVEKLERAIAEVDTLSGLLPICSGCKKIRDDSGYWTHVESYLSAHTAAEFSHGLCPECMRRLYPEYVDEQHPAETAGT